MTDLAKKLIAGMIEKNSELEFKIRTNTELYRKGFGKILLQNPDGTPFSGNAEIILNQKSHEYYFGSNLFMLDEFPEKEKNAQYRELFPEYFNFAVIPFYWRDYEPEPDKPRCEKNCSKIYRRPSTDLCVEFCEEKNLEMKGHPLCWGSWLPQWLPADRREVMRRLDKRFAQISGRYADKIRVFDAINEVITCDARPDTPYPDGIMEEAFRLGEKYFPNNQLILNEDRNWWDNRGEHTWFFMLAKELIAHGHRPGGLGFQYHFFPRYFEEEYKHFTNAENLYSLLDRYATLGIPCSMTEISVSARTDLFGNDAEKFQEIFVDRLYRLWFSHPATEGIVWWNPVDGTAAGSVLGGNTGENAFRAGLFNFDLTPKPAAKLLKNLIQNEWTTKNAKVDWTPGGDNRFQGFRGAYDAEIRTDSGTFHRTVVLSSHTSKNIKVTL